MDMFHRPSCVEGTAQLGKRQSAQLPAGATKVAKWHASDTSSRLWHPATPRARGRHSGCRAAPAVSTTRSVHLGAYHLRWSASARSFQCRARCPAQRVYPPKTRRRRKTTQWSRTCAAPSPRPTDTASAIPASAKGRRTACDANPPKGQEGTKASRPTTARPTQGSGEHGRQTTRDEQGHTADATRGETSDRGRDRRRRRETGTKRALEREKGA